MATLNLIFFFAFHSLNSAFFRCLRKIFDRWIRITANTFLFITTRLFKKKKTLPVLLISSSVDLCGRPHVIWRNALRRLREILSL